MKIVLVQLNDREVYAAYKRNVTKRTPLGLAYVAAARLSEGHEVEIVDAALDDLDVQQTIDAILSKNPHMIGVTCTTPLFPQLCTVIQGVKTIRPDIYAEIGGVHVSALPAISLKKSGANSICIGDGENINDLDKIPYPARHILRMNEYVDYARGVLTPQTSIITSRGCVGKCGFCNAGDTIVRFRSVENVMGELEEIYHKYGIRNLVFYDDSFTTKKSRVIEICNEMIKRGLNFTYQVQLRLDQLDDDVMDALVRSGCDQVGPGIESGNSEILKSIGKRITPELILEKCKLVSKYPVKNRCSYIMGWIDETEEQIWDTIHLAQEINAHENAFSIATPYPGSRMWREALAKGLVQEDMDFSRFFYYHKIGCNMSKVPNDRLMELHELAYKQVGNRAYKLNEQKQ